ncbi:MAG TPA: hypothetical protein IAB12_05880 [Candidatus Ornithospirochaeta avicola]|uniref:Uncharacterized protein n=1 Tax=Candidatus Ornithospirochaeta avicola TaxID=2840896 RepID=A0A9D1TPC3_9SPIO|nr:hypothetical protein [Candidatus Ornithospirochaeta avicola]
MMLKLRILNIPGFIKTINSCKGRILKLDSDGNKVNIKGQIQIQKEMENQYKTNGNFLPISLNFEKPEDYLSVVYYYIGDC